MTFFMQKRFSLILMTVFSFLLLSADLMAGTKYIYRRHLNWVKIDKASPKEVPLGTLRHPYTDLTADDFEAMLLSIKIAKRYMLKNNVKTVDVFNLEEARRFAPYLVEALAAADADSVVAFAVIHKRPVYFLKNDRLSIGNLWAGEDGIHIRFNKLFAKLEGDYEASANTDKAIRKAKSLRITLEAKEGQKLSYESATEIILDPGYDFGTQVAADMAAKEEAAKFKPKKKSKAEKEAQRKEGTEISPQTSASSETAPPPVVSPIPKMSSTSLTSSTTERLRKIDQLKKDQLITEKEYQELRQKILSGI